MDVARCSVRKHGRTRIVRAPENHGRRLRFVVVRVDPVTAGETP